MKIYNNLLILFADTTLKQNKLHLLNQKEDQSRNLEVIEHAVGKNYQTQLNFVNNQYRNSIE